MDDGNRGHKRPSIAGLMACVLCVGLGLAALRNADQWWARGAYTVAITAIASALVLATIGGRRIRGISTGFTVFGLTYLLIDLLPPRSINSFGFGPQSYPSLLIEQGFVLIQPFLKPMPNGDTQGFIHYDQVGHSLAVLIFGSIGAILGRLASGDRDKHQAEARPAATRANEGT
jgi:hypothetical protein